MRRLFKGEDPHSSSFFQHISPLNNAFSFGAINCRKAAQPTPFDSKKPGRPVFRVQGNMCFTVANPIPLRLRLLNGVANVDPPNPGSPPRNLHMASEAYSAFYVYDTAEQANDKRQKMAGCQDCPRELISLLTDECRKHSPYRTILQQLFTFEQQQKENGTPIPPLNIHFSKPSPYQPLSNKPRDPKHSVNIPNSGEISIVMVGPDVPKHPGFILPMGNGELRFLPYTDANTDPVCFFLLFPCGEMGWDGSWHPAEKKKTKETNERAQNVEDGVRETREPPFAPQPQLPLPSQSVLNQSEDNGGMHKENENEEDEDGSLVTPHPKSPPPPSDAETVGKDGEPVEDPLPFAPDPLDARAGADGYDSDYSELERDQEQDIEGDNEPQKHHTPRKIPSCRCFYATRLFERAGDERWSPILHARRLLEQYIVMSWLKVENTRLDYYRFHQPRLRSLSFNGAMDQVEGDHLEFNAAPEDSRRVILPPSYSNGPRHLNNNYYNTIQLGVKEGAAHYFLTVTCNPFWPEIQENLATPGPYGPAETAYDRPDLVVRVFKQKLDFLMKRLQEGDLGTFIWGTYRVEFQQRGLPHAHIVFRVAQDYAPTNPAIIDRIINAYSPDPNTQPNLYKNVQTYMMHTKCGENATCWDALKHRCGSGFPREFTDHTVIHDNGRVEYKRPVVTVEDVQENKLLNSRLVVAHNRYLLLLLNCHCNLEVVQNDSVMKYLFKYINKQSDKVWFAAARNDEIARYQEGRCIGACKASWHLLAYPIVWCSHSILPLPVHLEDKQIIFYHENTSKKGMKKLHEKKHPLWLGWQQMMLTTGPVFSLPRAATEKKKTPNICCTRKCQSISLSAKSLGNGLHERKVSRKLVAFT
jgi:hypothetical protein